MILFLKQNVAEHEVKHFCQSLQEKGIVIAHSDEDLKKIMLLGDLSQISQHDLRAHEIVREIQHVSSPYKKASRVFRQTDTLVHVGNAKFGQGFFSVIAGPCSVESEAQMQEITSVMKQSGASLLRGGAFKPRTSPYAFQGMGMPGLDLLRKAREQSGIPIVTEIMSAEHLPFFSDVDILQVGARNMQNFELLKALGKVKNPVLLKRGFCATIDEWLMSAEYLLSGGNENVILCERGIRTFEPSTRNTLDLSAVVMLKEKTHLPVIVDPSHACGLAWMVEPLALAAIAAGADGLMIEVHQDPQNAKSDGEQSLTPNQFYDLMKKVEKTVSFFGKTLSSDQES